MGHHHRDPRRPGLGLGPPSLGLAVGTPGKRRTVEVYLDGIQDAGSLGRLRGYWRTG